MVRNMKNYLVHTTQKTPGITSTSDAQVAIDWEKEEFLEKSTFLLDNDISFSSTLSYQNQVLRLDGDPISSNAKFWLNQSSHLVGLCATKHHQSKATTTTSEGKYLGTIQELNRICENQLNLSELGQDSNYALKFSSAFEGDTQISLTITNPRSDTVFEQITVLQKDSSNSP